MTEFAIDAARTVVRATRSARDRRWRQPPRLRVDPHRPGAPQVYYLSPCPRTPAGGVRVIYRHVDLLNEAGVPAAVVHTQPGFRCRWFANETRLVSPSEAVLRPADILVVPEVFGPGLGRLPQGPPVVIFNQNAYHTFDAVPFSSTRAGDPYAGLDGLVALLTVSEDNEQLLRYTFPTVAVHLVRPVVDGATFKPGPCPDGGSPT